MNRLRLFRRGFHYLWKEELIAAYVLAFGIEAEPAVVVAAVACFPGAEGVGILAVQELHVAAGTRVGFQPCALLSAAVAAASAPAFALVRFPWSGPAFLPALYGKIRCYLVYPSWKVCRCFRMMVFLLLLEALRLFCRRPWKESHFHGRC